MKNSNNNITSIGHAGFVYSTKDFIIIMDPWLSSEGAYFNSWYQFPRNHHLEIDIIELISKDARKKYIYLSHHDKDHIDISFLESIKHENIIYFIPNFSKTGEMIKELVDICGIDKNKIYMFHDEEKIKIFEHEIIFYIQDSTRESDSSIFIKI